MQKNQQLRRVAHKRELSIIHIKSKTEVNKQNKIKLKICKV